MFHQFFEIYNFSLSSELFFPFLFEICCSFPSQSFAILLDHFCTNVSYSDNVPSAGLIESRGTKRSGLAQGAVAVAGRR